MDAVGQQLWRRRRQGRGQREMTRLGVSSSGERRLSRAAARVAEAVYRRGETRGMVGAWWGCRSATGRLPCVAPGSATSS
eukprot:1918962-Prymnesium_polylepis.1